MTIFYCRQHLGFIFDAANKGIRIEDVDLNQVHLLTDASNIQRLLSNLTDLLSERFVASPQGKLNLYLLSFESILFFYHRLSGKVCDAYIF